MADRGLMGPVILWMSLIRAGHGSSLMAAWMPEPEILPFQPGSEFHHP